MTMADRVSHLDRIVTMSGEQLLQGAGSVSHEQAIDKARDEYKKYQSLTLSDVEHAYLDCVEELSTKTKKQS